MIKIRLSKEGDIVKKRSTFPDKKRHAKTLIAKQPEKLYKEKEITKKQKQQLKIIKEAEKRQRQRREKELKSGVQIQKGIFNNVQVSGLNNLKIIPPTKLGSYVWVYYDFESDSGESPRILEWRRCFKYKGKLSQQELRRLMPKFIRAINRSFKKASKDRGFKMSLKRVKKINLTYTKYRKTYKFQRYSNAESDSEYFSF